MSSKISNKELAALWQSLIVKIKEDPIKYFIKAPGFLNFTPTPAQITFLKVVFQQRLDPITKHKVYRETIKNGFNLEFIEMTEVEIYEYLSEKEYIFNKNHDKFINMINLILGRRAGKTTISAMLAIYFCIINNWKPFLVKTPSAHVLILSHSREFSDEILDLIRTLINESPILSLFINKQKKNTASTMNLKVPWIVENKIEWSRVQIKVGAASKKTVRGTAACAVLLDEIAYWNLDDNLKETDVEILKAVRPNMKQFGRLALMIKLSSPGIKQGVLYNEYIKWKKGELPDNYAIFKCPSWVFNTILPKEEYVIEHKLDPEGFNTEYRANFVDSISNFISTDYVDLAVMKGVKFNPPEDKTNNIKYVAAIDAAFKGDKFTFSLVGIKENRVTQYISKGWEGTRLNPVKASDVALYIRNMQKNYGFSKVYTDQYAFQPLKELFQNFDVVLEEFTFNITQKKKIFYNLKRLIHSQKLDLLDNEHQTKEIKELIVEQTPSGQIRISHPTGGHDDFADSLAISSYIAVQQAGKGQFNFESAIAGAAGAEVPVDNNGKAFVAPNPTMLSDMYGYEIAETDHLYSKDPDTGKLVLIEDLDENEAEEGIQIVF